MQRKAYALVGAAAAIAAAVGPLLGGFITTYLSWRIAFLGEVVDHRHRPGGQQARARRAVHGRRGASTSSARSSRPSAWAASCSRSWSGRRAARRSARCSPSAIAAHRCCSSGGCAARKRRGQAGAARHRRSSRRRTSGSGITSQTLQQIALGGMMIALPIYLQMVLEYDAMEAGLSLAPLSLTMFAVALVAGRKAGNRSPSRIILAGFVLLVRRRPGAAAARAARGLGLGPGPAAGLRRRRARPARLAAEQLHPLAHRGGARQRGGGRQLRRRLVRPLLRPRVRRARSCSRRCRSCSRRRPTPATC